MALHNDVLAEQVWQFLCNAMDSCQTVNRKRQRNYRLTVAVA